MDAKGDAPGPQPEKIAQRPKEIIRAELNETSEREQLQAAKVWGMLNSLGEGEKQKVQYS